MLLTVHHSAVQFNLLQSSNHSSVENTLQSCSLSALRSRGKEEEEEGRRGRIRRRAGAEKGGGGEGGKGGRGARVSLQSGVWPISVPAGLTLMACSAAGSFVARGREEAEKREEIPLDSRACWRKVMLEAPVLAASRYKRGRTGSCY